MAFATTNVRSDTMGSIKVTHGSWSASAGDAAGTIGVEGGYVLGVLFFSFDSTGAIQLVPARASLSTSGNVTTVTVYHQEEVTTGRFIIFHA